MKLEDLFVDTMEDLRRRCDLRATEYDMVQAAGLIRKLILNGNPLWAQVNRSLRLQPRYSWMDFVMSTAGGHPELALLWLDPAMFQALMQSAVEAGGRPVVDPSPPREGDLAAFLRVPVVQYGGENATVLDLVRHFANREGGIHFDPKQAETPLLELVRREEDEGLRLTLVATGRVVYRALEPLAARVALASRAPRYGLAQR